MMMSTSAEAVAGAQASVATAHICFPARRGFAICSRPERPTPKSACFRSEVMFQLLSISLQDGICFVGYPIPAALSASLTSCFPLQENIGFTTFHMSTKSRLGSAFPPVVQHLRQRTVDSLNLTTYFLVQACQHLWLVVHDDVYQQFTFINHTTQFERLRRLMLAVESHCPKGFAPCRCQQRTLW